VSSPAQRLSLTLPVPPSSVVDEIKLRSPKKSHHYNHHVLRPSHARTPIHTLATTHPQLPTPSLQTPHTTVNEVATDLVVPTHHPMSTFPSPDIPILSANPSQSKNQPEALHHQTTAQQVQCHIQYGWPAPRRISVQAGSGCPHKGSRVVCIIRPKRENERGSGRAEDIIHMIRIPRVPILGGTEKENEKEKGRGREPETKSRHRHRRSVGGRRT
jgi:hypothetical protein